ncbi:helix-turn-helix domain-containing protein [Paenibacillus wynnii]|uniref:helix-turn-helix domain-containing protein n=1 Tax=Paenibacillus wynnii TaxID=268407 RepID=UPI0027925B4E|nr:AraC family transcriptional regulator [Paenibacillus wynnii]MDQ0195712.1 two-component system response regulator YesN [Paenibacillus wynnii]
MPDWSILNAKRELGANNLFEITLLEKNDPIKLLQVSYLQQLIRDDWHNLAMVNERLQQIQLAPLTEDEVKLKFVAVQLRLPQGRKSGRQERHDSLHLNYQGLCWETAALNVGIYAINYAANPYMANFLIIGDKENELEGKTEGFVQELKQNIVNELKLDSVFGMGREVKGLHNLKNGYASSMVSWGHNAVSTGQNEDRNKILDQSYDFPVESSRKMAKSIENSDMSSLREQMEALFPTDKNTPSIVFIHLSLHILLLLSSITRKFECGSTSLQNYIWNCQMTLMDYSSREGLLEKMEELAQLVIEEVRRTRTSDNQHMEAVRKHVEEHFSNELSLSYLSELFHVNVPRLSDQFKQHVGISVNKYVSRLRITKAEQLLQQHEMKINDIARLVGYSDPESFTTCYTKNCGESPMEYRERYLQKKLPDKRY